MSVCIKPSSRENGEGKGIYRIDPNSPVPNLLQAQPALSILLPQSVGCPGTESYTAPSPNSPTLNEWKKTS